MHVVAGDVAGFAIYYDSEDAQTAQASGVGKAVIDVCEAINEGVPEYDREPGTDLRFVEIDDAVSVVETAVVEDDPEFYLPTIPVAMSNVDAAYIIAHLPSVFLDRAAVYTDDEA